MTVPTAQLPLPPAVAHLTVFRGANPDYVAVFVEGPDDVEAWKPWLKWRPFPVGGCGPVLSSIEELRQEGQSGFLGIIDADCERLEGRDHSSSDIVVTEFHDHECDLLRSPAFDRLLESVDDDRLQTLLAGKDIREALVQRGQIFGLLRWHCFRHKVKYPAGRLSPHRFLGLSDWALNEAAVMAEASLALGQPEQDLVDELERLRRQGNDGWNVCNGHDLLAILAVAMRGPLGAPTKYPQVSTLSTALHLSMDSSHLGTLRVWRALQSWQAQNPPWVICRP